MTANAKESSVEAILDMLFTEILGEDVPYSAETADEALDTTAAKMIDMATDQARIIATAVDTALENLEAARVLAEHVEHNREQKLALIASYKQGFDELNEMIPAHLMEMDELNNEIGEPGVGEQDAA